jgi:signal peptidase I
VFRPPEHASTDYIKRIIGMPGDRIQLIDGVIYINGTPVERKPVNDFGGTNPCGGESDPRILARVTQWRETLPDGVSYDTLECRAINGFPDTTPVYMVPPGHYFMMGDDRENSEDSRFSDVGYIPFENIVGRADIIFFSIKRGHIWEIWRWPWSVRWNRLLRTIH